MRAIGMRCSGCRMFALRACCDARRPLRLQTQFCNVPTRGDRRPCGGAATNSAAAVRRYLGVRGGRPWLQDRGPPGGPVWIFALGRNRTAPKYASPQIGAALAALLSRCFTPSTVLTPIIWCYSWPVGRVELTRVNVLYIWSPPRNCLPRTKSNPSPL